MLSHVTMHTSQSPKKLSRVTTHTPETPKLSHVTTHTPESPKLSHVTMHTPELPYLETTAMLPKITLIPQGFSEIHRNRPLAWIWLPTVFITIENGLPDYLSCNLLCFPAQLLKCPQVCKLLSFCWFYLLLPMTQCYLCWIAPNKQIIGNWWLIISSFLIKTQRV